MRRLLELIFRLRVLLTFLVLQVVAFIIIVSFNERQSNEFDSFMLSLGGGLNELNQEVGGYFALGSVNDELSLQLKALREENDRLQAEVQYLRNTLPDSGTFYAFSDSLLPWKRFRYTPCRALENTLNNNYNYIVLNVGQRHGIRPMMGVISSTGVVGVVSSVSEHHALALSLLNRNLKLSVRIKGKQVLGTFNWKGGSTRYGTVDFVPLHYQPEIGDTIVTSNFSTIFPEGFNVGYITDIDESENNGFYDLTIRLATDFSRLDYLLVAETDSRAEQDSLVARYTPD